MDSARTAPRQHPHSQPPPAHQYPPQQNYASHVASAPTTTAGLPPPPPPLSHPPQNVSSAVQQGPQPAGSPQSRPHQYQPYSTTAQSHNPYAPPSQSPAATAHPYPLPPRGPEPHSQLPPINTSQPHPSPVGHPQSAPPYMQSYAQEQGHGGLTQGYRPPVGSGEAESQYQQHNRSGHATPALVTHRSLSHELPPQQRPPSTPAQGGHPPGLDPNGGRPMEVMYQHPPNGNHHSGMPPPYHTHSQPVPYGSTPVNHQGYGPPPPHEQAYHYSDAGGQYGPNSAQGKRRPTRAQQACDQCRQRKQKCDEGQPCSFCKESNIECKYRDTPVIKTDKNTERIMDSLESIMKRLDRMDERNERIDERNERMDEMNNSLTQRLSRVEDQMDTKPQGSAVVEPPQQPTPAPSDVPDNVRGQRQHRTGPHNLVFLWPSIIPLFKPGEYPQPTYVMKAEQRGVLRIYGRGEGVEDQDGTQPTMPGSPGPSDDGSENAPTPQEGLWGRGFSNNNSASSARPVSTVGGLKPDGSLDLDSATIMSLYDSYINHMHCMHPFIDKGRSRRLIDVFISSYSPDNRLRPSFAAAPTNSTSTHNEGEWDRPAKRLRVASPGSNMYATSPDNNVAHNVNTTSSSSSNTHNTVRTGTKNSLSTERSPANALVWLMLALGKICQHKEPLPPLAENVPPAKLTGIQSHGTSPTSASIRAASPRTSPNTQTTPPELGGYKMEHTRSRRSSHDSGSSSGQRNLDVIPGLAYFGKASEILGDQGAGQDLVHAQMFLLAALYTGQLARVQESMAWLSRAGQVCLQLIDRHDLYKPVELIGRRGSQIDQAALDKYADFLDQKFSDKRNRLVVIASWSTLQLESDILAELKFPASGISGIEKGMLLPSGNLDLNNDEQYDDLRGRDPKQEKAEEQRIMRYYSAQLFLRRRLNDLHAELYGHQLTGSVHAVREKFQAYEQSLSAWRNLLPEELKWSDKDAPASDILAARLRAKYYGAVYVSTRPYVDYALNIMPRVRNGESIVDAAVNVKGEPREETDISVFRALQSIGVDEILEGCKRCIQAALHSTVALDGVPQRLIVTNIHGTAHAQFGNMLVLSAVYHQTTKIDYGTTLIDTKEFRDKLKRTIRFLRRLAPISRTLFHDATYLEGIEKLLFPLSEDARDVYAGEIEPMSANASFSA